MNRYARRIGRFWKALGPGLITGASDDDPSGIATYTQAGASFGLTTLWTAWVTFPLMAAMQQMCARIGIVTGHGLTGILKRHYPKPVLYLMIAFSVPAITLNIGSDIAGMGAVCNLLVPQVPTYAFSIAFTALIIFAIIRFPYRRFASVLKWLCASLLLYLIVPFMVDQDWGAVLRNTLVPANIFDKDYIAIFVAILGTTISPYLFFWQATMEVEEMQHRKRIVVVDKRLIHMMQVDVDFGILFSNIVFYFIMLTAGSVLFTSGVRHIDTVEEAARALKPLAGNGAYLLFALGVLGTGLLAIPVLAGSLSYILAETFEWQQGMDKKFHEAKGFYLTMAASLIVGAGINLLGISPVKALIYTAILYGVTAPVLIFIILHVCNNKAVMGKFTNGTLSNVLGYLTFALMTAAAIALLWITIM